jgi:predicted DNA-binding helix-hairpin-helix protein
LKIYDELTLRFTVVITVYLNLNFLKKLVIYLFQTIIEQHTGDIEEIDISPQEIVDLIIDEVEVGYISSLFKTSCATKIACRN